MADYIKRSEVVLWLTKQRYAQPDRPNVQAELVDDILCNAAQHFLKIPSADVVEVRHGKWEDRKGLYEVGYKCSLCGFFSLTRTNFCPNCGSYNGGEHGT